MQESQVLVNPFQIIAAPERSGLSALAARWLEKPLSRLSGLGRCAELYSGLDQGRPDLCFAEEALVALGVDWRLSGSPLRKVPASGPLVIVANHPFGGLEGLVLLAVLRRLRPDLKLLANHLLWRIPELREAMIPVDPFEAPNSRLRNVASMRRALHWLRDGGAVVVFPAGEVSHFQFTEKAVSDPVWQNGVGRLIQRSGAAAVPVYFSGRNHWPFQAAGLIHPRLRTLLLPRQILNKRGLTIKLVLGNTVPAKRLQQFGQAAEITDYLRLRTYVMAHLAQGEDPRAQAGPDRERQPLAAIISPVPPEVLTSEIAALPQTCLLHSHGSHQAWCIDAAQAPAVLREIGRLRETTFRRHGEGTGLKLDLDAFDDYYQHLFLWQSEKQEIIGAYRIGRTDRILAEHGVDGLYTSSLFSYRREFFTRIGPALELGRSFIRPEYQRSFIALLLLWQGIGRFLVQNPEYRTLFGPVSISRTYSDFARQLMANALSRQRSEPALSRLVAARCPVAVRRPKIRGCASGLECLSGAEIPYVDAFLAEVDVEGKGLPVLLRHYLNLGGKILGFNLDAVFSDVIDGLILVALDETDPKTLTRYMGRDGYATFMASDRTAPLRKVSCCLSFC